MNEVRKTTQSLMIAISPDEEEQRKIFRPRARKNPKIPKLNLKSSRGNFIIKWMDSCMLWCRAVYLRFLIVR